ncbi:MAG: D-aminoacyl-tRNA deacylase [Chitinispirillaceae bacterium]|nr:D-aminoacyl-tRNA deacylase [Chitinispirillaceae bacterium]
MVDNKVVGSIGYGALIFVGVHSADTAGCASFLAAKCADLRVFGDNAGKMNCSLKETGGSALVVSQFTLYGDCSKGRRPSFIEAAPPDKGKELYELFVAELGKHVPDVQTGIFGADMQVELVNDGPVTMILEKYVSASG